MLKGEVKMYIKLKKRKNLKLLLVRREVIKIKRGNNKMEEVKIIWRRKWKSKKMRMLLINMFLVNLSKKIK